MFTKAFLSATAERAVATAAQSALLVIGADQFDVLHADLASIGGFALGGAVLAVLKALMARGISGGGPSLTDAEHLA